MFSMCMNIPIVKGIVRQKLTGVLIDIKRQIFVICLDTDLFSNFKGKSPFKLKKLVSTFQFNKNIFDASNQHRLQETSSSVLIHNILLSQLTRYITYYRNWSPATTIYLILVPCYKSIADIEILGHRWRHTKDCYIAVTRNQLTGIDEIIKISATVHRICSRNYIDSTQIIGLPLHAETGFIYLQ